jgi:hypothetical protein
MLLVHLEHHGNMKPLFVYLSKLCEIRLTMMNNLNWVQTIDHTLLICGSDVLTYEENINILKHAFNFIKSSERFLVV